MYENHLGSSLGILAKSNLVTNGSGLDNGTFKFGRDTCSEGTDSGSQQFYSTSPHPHSLHLAAILRSQAWGQTGRRAKQRSSTHINKISTLNHEILYDPETELKKKSLEGRIQWFSHWHGWSVVFLKYSIYHGGMENELSSPLEWASRGTTNIKCF